MLCDPLGASAGPDAAGARSQDVMLRAGYCARAATSAPLPANGSMKSSFGEGLDARTRRSDSSAEASPRRRLLDTLLGDAPPEEEPIEVPAPDDPVLVPHPAGLHWRTGARRDRRLESFPSGPGQTGQLPVDVRHEAERLRVRQGRERCRLARHRLRDARARSVRYHLEAVLQVPQVGERRGRGGDMKSTLLSSSSSTSNPGRSLVRFSRTRLVSPAGNWTK